MASGEQWDAETMRAAAVFPNHRGMLLAVLGFFF